MVWISEEDIVEPNGWIDEWYLDPTFPLLPVQPPEVNTLSLPRTKDYLKPVGHKLKNKAIVKSTSYHSILTFLSEGTKGTYFLVWVRSRTWTSINTIEVGNLDYTDGSMPVALAISSYLSSQGWIPTLLKSSFRRTIAANYQTHQMQDDSSLYSSALCLCTYCRLQRWPVRYRYSISYNTHSLAWGTGSINKLWQFIR